MEVQSGSSAVTRGAAAPTRRVRARVEGAVQGVGFRPYVYRLARSLGLAGFVLNDERGVLVELEGGPTEVQRFLDLLPAEAPPLAIVERVTSTEVDPVGASGFTISRSEAGAGARTLLAPDVATCDACLAELFDPGDRRWRYPFLNCTDCGPRFTIVRSLPYDRPATTMVGFTMCDACRSEYDDPADRRFHAQPNACPACGPRLALTDALGRAVAFVDQDAVQAAARALASGAVVAVKGLGGYHLACRADDEAALRRLREGKGRPDKPFAVMAGSLEGARRLALLSDAEAALLASRERPIVLATRRPGGPLTPSVAPGQRDVGLMLPYTPLHHLLLADAGEPLVMTSGNLTGEPIAHRDDDALDRLSGVADLFLTHDRPIHSRADDSVERCVHLPQEGGGSRPSVLTVRRSRGQVPLPLRLPVPARRPVLAVGGHLKNTFCVARGERAWMGPHVGDLSDWETLAAFREGVAHLASLFDVEPEVVAHDLHPDYLSTREALATPAGVQVAVQHHHAHLAACLAEHGEEGPALGAIFDGTGYGPDGTVWGGELLLGDLSHARRVGHLRPVRLPGGEAAVKEPWRMACAWLVELAGEGEVPPLPPSLAGSVDPADWRAVAGLARTGLASPVTTSMGRLFDAVAALCGLHPTSTFEGQAAMALEAAAAEVDGLAPRPYVLDPVERVGATVLDPLPLLRAVRGDVESGVGPPRIAAGFHEALADATARWCWAEAGRGGVDVVALSGGVWQNVRLLERTAALLQGAGLRVLVPARIPPNDGGLAFGQAAVAAARTSEPS